MLQELASKPAIPQEQKPRTATDLIDLAKKRHNELLKQSLQESQEGSVASVALLLLYETHAIDHENLDSQAKNLLRKRTYGKPLIDLGAGNGIDSETIRYFGFSPYVGVDLLADRLPLSRNRMVQSDALSLLFKIPDEYANVMANGFLCRDWFPSGMEEYVIHALRQIRKVLPREGGVFIASHFEFKDEALAAGLKINEELSKVRGNITVFERGILPSGK